MIKISVKPLEITLRDKIGIQVEPEHLENVVRNQQVAEFR